jgi:hypothetical protein
VGSPAITDALQCENFHPPFCDAPYYSALADGVCSCHGNDMVELFGQLLHSGMRHMVGISAGVGRGRAVWRASGCYLITISSVWGSIPFSSCVWSGFLKSL